MKKLLIFTLFSFIINADQATQNLARYMMANYYQFGNDLKSAGHWYSQIQPGPDSIHVYSGYIPYLAANGSFADIAQLIPQLDKSFKNNQEIQLLFATALESIGKKNDAHSRLIMLNENNKSNQELAFKVVQMYLERAEPENALTVIKNLLNNSVRRPNNFIFHFIESQIYLQLNKKHEALASIKHCIEAYPKFDKSWLLYAVLHEQEGKIEEAIKGYTTFLEVSDQPNREIERHLLMLAFRQKMHIPGHTINHNQQLTLAAQSVEKREYTKALTHIDHYLTHAPDDIEGRLMKLQILAHLQYFDKTAQLLKQWIAHDNNAELWLKATHLLTYLGLPYTTALSIIHETEKQKGSSLSTMLYSADFALRASQPEKALPELQKIYTQTHDAALKAKTALQIALIYFDQKKWGLAQKTLEEALLLNHTYPPLNNLLAHIYATKTNTVAKAHEQINHALQHDPHNPHFLDTKALILYKENKLDQSIALLQKIAHKHPTDYTVLCHLGKCYYKNGNTKKAIDTMKAAAQIAKNDHDKTKAETRLKQWSK